MTRKSRRELKREVAELSERNEQRTGGVVVLCEHEDGTVTDPGGDRIKEDALKTADVVVEVSWDVAKTWPDTNTEEVAE